jgi:protein TonB
MKRMLPAFLSAVLIHAIVLTADITGLMRQSLTVPTAQVITMRLVERAPYRPPAMRPLSGPPPPLPPAPPKPALKKPVINPLPVVNPPKPIARKPPEKSVPAQPPPVPAVPEAEAQSPPPPADPDPAHMSTDLPLSPTHSPLPAPSVDSHAALEEKSSTASAVVMATPRYSNNPPPAYPAIARKRGYEGTVVLDVLVDQNGRVGRLRVAESSSFRLLDRSAIKAVKGWQFEPGREGNKAVAMWVRVPVDFCLQQ